MKKVFLAVIFGILSLTLSAQVSFDSVAYKAFQKVSLSYTGRDTTPSDVLFWFAKNRASLSTNDQTKNLYFVKFFEETLKTGHKVTRVQCKDNGGFNCVLSTGFDNGYNFISVEYSNLVFFYKVSETSERPWDNDPVELKPYELINRKYTPEDLKFWYKLQAIDEALLNAPFINEFFKDW
jgi:hypothetical protein